jgi:hypothetical protein
MSDFSSYCTSCQSTSCSCSSSCPATPQPYYAAGSPCLEDSCASTTTVKVYGSVRAENSFNMPACAGSVQIKISNVQSLTVGAYLWNPSVGYLQIIAYDQTTGLITAQNNCDVGNAAAGTAFPGCLDFVVTAPPPASASGSSPTGIFVAIDFTAPNNGTCLLITVTGVDGLSVGKNVQIGSGTYRIGAIPSATTIEICNDGAGIVPGSPVIAKNGAGAYQYPLVLIDVNPCTNEPVTSGALIVCKDDIMQPLSGATAGSIPVLQDPETGEVQYQTLDVPTRTCTAITCCLTIVSGLAGPYIVPVGDSSEFTVGDVVQIGTRTDRLTITSIPDATTIIGTLDPVPGATVDIEPGTSLCIQDCCENLQTQLDDLIVDIASGCAIAVGPTVEIGGTVTPQPDDPAVDVGNAAGNVARWDANPDSVMITNDSDCKNRVVFAQFRARVSINQIAAVAVDGVIAFGFALDIGGGPVDVAIRKPIHVVAGAYPHDVEVNWTEIIVLVPLASVTITATPYIEYDQGGVNFFVNVGGADMRIHSLINI